MRYDLRTPVHAARIRWRPTQWSVAASLECRPHPVASYLVVSRGVLPPELPANGGALDAADEARVDAVHRARALERDEALAQLREQRAQLEPRQVRAEADVLAAAEADVIVRIPVDAEDEGVLEHLLVAVARGVEQAHGLPFPHDLVADVKLPRGGARELVHRRHPAHGLLDHAVDQARVRE